MQIEQTGLAGCMVIKPAIFEDARGYFFESFNRATFEQLTGSSGNFVQDNQSMSEYGVIRGLHAQAGDFAQAKLVRVISGEVLDVAVDARPGSPTYGEHFSIKLSAENKLQLYVPRGFLHGFCVLSETAEFFYKCDNFYNKASEYGVKFDDSDLGIDWMVKTGMEKISDKDLVQGTFKALQHG